MMLRLALLASFVSSASALCAGTDQACSGHGKCGNFDKCECYRNWQGEDCSQRTCAFSTSWNEIVLQTSTVNFREHSYTECSSKGDCDRKTGLCKCYDGFTGSACRRMKCDNDCSAHGVCETLSRESGAGYYGWDAEKIQQCVCDPGWEGDKCDKKMCKKGDDPLTLANYDAGSWTAQAAETQQLVFADFISGDKVTISYTDYRGQVYTTWPLDAYTGTAIMIKEALEALPNEAVPSVTVTGADLVNGVGTLIVTFSAPMNSGNQEALIVNSDGCEDPGCQPLFGNPAGTVSVTSSDGTTEWNVCSNRGSCNSETGDCVCFDGFMGEACEIQTIIG